MDKIVITVINLLPQCMLGSHPALPLLLRYMMMMLSDTPVLAGSHSRLNCCSAVKVFDTAVCFSWRWICVLSLLNFALAWFSFPVTAAIYLVNNVNPLAYN